MGSPRRTESRERERTGLRRCLLVLLFLAPLPFGAVEPWAVATLQVSAAALGAWALSLHLREGAHLPAGGRSLVALSLVPLVVGILQLVPLPSRLLRPLAPRIVEARDTVAAVVPETASAAFPLSLSAPDTLDAVLRYAACLFVGLTAAVGFSKRTHLREAAAVLVGAAAFQGLYGSAEYLSGRQHIFAYAKRWYTQEATGTFINRNHFAEYLALALPFALWLALDTPSPGRPRSFRETLLRLGEPAGLRRAAAWTAAALIWLGILLSYSRGGLAAALVACGILAGCGVARRRKGLLVGLVLLVPTAYLLWAEVRGPGERFVAAGSSELSSLGGRVPVWRETLRIVADHPAAGTGLGTFAPAFVAYRSAEIRLLWDHAHSDWLESLAEGGVAVFLAFFLLALLVARALTHPDPFAGRPSAPQAALLSSLAAAGLHAFVDFGLRIPAIAITVAAILGMTRSVQPTGTGPPRSRSRLGSARRLLPAAPALLAVLALTTFAVWSEAPGGATRPGRLLAPPPRALREAVEQELRVGVETLEDVSRPAPERLAIYRDRLRSAEPLLVKVLALNPAQPWALSSLAAVRFELHPPLEAEAVEKHLAMLDLASRMAPRDPRVQIQVAEVLLKMGRRDEALPYLRHATSLDRSEIRRVVGLLRDNLFSIEAILGALGRDEAVLICLRDSFVEEGRMAEYADLLEEALVRPSRDLLQAYGDACRALAETERLLATLDRIGTLPDSSLEAERRSQRARALASRGEWRRALEEARAAAALQEEDPAFARLRGDIALAAGETEEAIAAFRESLSLAVRRGSGPSWSAALYRDIGRAQERSGRPHLAYDAYRKALELDPHEAHSRRRLVEMEQAAGVPARPTGD